MGSTVTINDTLQLTAEQGFPAELVYEFHKNKPFTAQDFEGRIFAFKKPDIRAYQAAPVRNFLVQNIHGRWLYWGLVHILEVTHDYVHKTTSGKFKIIYLYPPQDMPTSEGEEVLRRTSAHVPKAFDLLDRRDDKNFFETVITQM